MEFLAQIVGAKVLKSQGCGRIELDMPETECMKDGMFGQLALQSLSQPVVRVRLEFIDQNEQSPQEEKPREKTVYERLRWEVVKDIWSDNEKDIAWIAFKEKAVKEKGLSPSIIESKSSRIWTPEEAQKLIDEFQGLSAYDS